MWLWTVVAEHLACEVALRWLIENLVGYALASLRHRRPNQHRRLDSDQDWDFVVRDLLDVPIVGSTL